MNSMNKMPRQYVFGEFFASMGGLSTAMVEMVLPLVKLGSLESIDSNDSSGIANDEDKKDRCRSELGQGHFAPVCRTLA